MSVMNNRDFTSIALSYKDLMLLFFGALFEEYTAQDWDFSDLAELS